MAAQYKMPNWLAGKSAWYKVLPDKKGQSGGKCGGEKARLQTNQLPRKLSVCNSAHRLS